MFNGVPKLTEYGRNQILNGSIKLNNYPIMLEGNPDTQPVCTYELGILVKLAQLLSTIINKKFDKQFNVYYNKENNLAGTLARLLLSKPVNYIRYEKIENNLNPTIIIEQLPARINFRFIASFEFLFYSFIYFLILFLFYKMDSAFIFLFLTIITLFLYIVSKIFFN